MHVSFALSISHFVSSVGADAGFAALVGLAILVLLYFAHARETSTLRNELAATTERLEELERRLASPGVSHVGARQPVGAAAPAAAAATATATAAARTAPAVAGRSGAGQATAARPVPRPPVAAPAGMGAPPLSDATRGVPLVQEPAEEQGAVPSDGRGSGAQVPAAPGIAGGQVAAAPLAAPQGTGAAPPAEALVQGSPPGDTRTSPAGGGSPPVAAPPPPGGRPPAVGRTPSPVTAAAGGNGFSAARGVGAGSQRSLIEHGLPGRRRTARWLIPLLGVVVLAAIAVVLVLVLSSGRTHHKTAVVHRHHKPNIAAAPPGVVRSSVTVSVINGTNINQLAHHIAAALTSGGFTEGTLATAATPSSAATVVAYLPGHRNGALAVAHALKLPASAVHSASSDTIGLVCPSVEACASDVIVVAGPNVAPKR